jgi:hypothetical protein
MDVEMLEEVVAECGEAHDTTPFLSDPHFKVMQDDIAYPAACLRVRVQMWEISHLRLRGEKHVGHCICVGGCWVPDSHERLLPVLRFERQREARAGRVLTPLAFVIATVIARKQRRSAVHAL